MSSSSNSSSSSTSSSSLSSSSLSSTSSFYIEPEAEFVTGQVLHGDVSFEVKIINIHSSVEIALYTFSEKYEYVDIEFLYRKENGDEWLTDASIAASTALFTRGNKLFRLPCSSTGYNNLIRWNFDENAFVIGSNFQIKIKIVPTIKTFNYYGSYTTIEDAYSNIFNEIMSVVANKVLGFDNYGNYMSQKDNDFIVVNKNGIIQTEYAGFGNIVCVQHLLNDNYLILDSDKNKLTEITIDGIFVYDIGSSAWFMAPPNFKYDEITNNVLISGGNTHKVYEITWNDNDKGTLIWQHGSTQGSGINQLSYPTGVSYDVNRDIVYILDEGNKRIKKIDRSGIIDVVTIYNNTQKDGITINFGSIYNIFTNNDEIMVIEKNQLRQIYNTNINLHVSLSRALGSGLIEYKNLLFAPLIGTNEDF